MRAISSFSLEAGISTFWCRALIALRIRVSISDRIGQPHAFLLLIRPFASAILTLRRRTCDDVFRLTSGAKARIGRHSTARLKPCASQHFYQDDFETPGISPRKAKPRKHRRQMPNLRKKARGRPQIWQRLCRRVENFGRFSLLSRAV